MNSRTRRHPDKVLEFLSIHFLTALRAVQDLVGVIDKRALATFNTTDAFVVFCLFYKLARSIYDLAAGILAAVVISIQLGCTISCDTWSTGDLKPVTVFNSACGNCRDRCGGFCYRRCWGGGLNRLGTGCTTGAKNHDCCQQKQQEHRAVDLHDTIISDIGYARALNKRYALARSAESPEKCGYNRFIMPDSRIYPG